MKGDDNISDAMPGRQLGHARDQELLVEKLDADRPVLPRHSLTRSVAIVATCMLATLIDNSNATSISICLPVIGKDVNIPEDQLQWLISVYSLSSGCLLLFFGRLADLYGRKKAFLIGTAWQLVCAIGLGFSTNGTTLVILRGLQGMGAAAAIPAALGTLAHSFPPSRARSIAFATFAAGAPLGGAFGSVIGGILTQLSGEHWRAPFFLSAALSAICVLGGLISFDSDESSSEADPRVDWIGAILVTSGLVLIMFVLGQGPTSGWNTPYMIVCLVIGIILVGIFAVWEHRLENSERSAIGIDQPKSFWTPPPLMKLSIFARAKGRISVIMAIVFLTWSGFVSWTFWVQLFYQNYLAITPMLTTVRLVPMFVMGLLCNFVVGMVVSRLPLVVFVVSGTLLTGFASVLFALIDPLAMYWAFEFPSTVMVVFGADFVYSAGTLFVANIVFPHEQSLAGGLFHTMAEVGTAFGLAISTIVFNTVVETQSTKLGVVVNSTGTNMPTSAALQGYKSAQWTSAAFPLFASLLAAIFLRNVGIVGHTRRAEQDQFGQTTTERQGDAQP